MISDITSVSILVTGFMVAFFHAMLPTHWLPFVLAAHGQGWSKTKTLIITMLSGLAHAAFTASLGVLIIFIGLKAVSWNDELFHLIAGLILIAIGCYYIFRQAKGLHGHCGHNHDHEAPKDLANLRTDKAVILGLLAMLALSPCEGFLPIYLSGAHYGWSGFILLTFILAAATSLGMAFFTWIALMGWEKLRLKALEEYEALILGTVLCILGLIIIFLEH